MVHCFERKSRYRVFSDKLALYIQQTVWFDDLLPVTMRSVSFVGFQKFVTHGTLLTLSKPQDWLSAVVISFTGSY